MAMSRKSDLPFGSEFSPSQIDLPAVLEMADTHGGDWRAFEEAVRVTYFDAHATSEYNRQKLANNTKLGMVAYGIIDRQASLTSFGKELLTLKDREADLHERLARQHPSESQRHDPGALHSGHDSRRREGQPHHPARRARRPRRPTIPGGASIRA